MTNKDNIIKDMVLSTVIGIGIGTIIALLSLWVADVPEVSLAKMVVIVVISGLIGLVSSLIFGINDLPSKISYPLHLIMVFGLVIAMNILNGWADGETLHNHALSVFLRFLLVYVGVWLFVTYLTHQKVSQINEKIKERKSIKGK